MKQPKFIIIFFILVILIVLFFVYALRQTQKSERINFGIDSLDLRYVNAISQLGNIQINVNGITWDVIEPVAPVNGVHNYRWDLLDAKYRILKSTGKDFIVDIEPYNKWAVDVDNRFTVTSLGMAGNIKHGAITNIKPEHIYDWKIFISEFLKRYPTKYLQIGSEAENIWYSYNGYLQDVCNASESAKKVDPDVKILIGGYNTGNFFALGPKDQKEMLNDSVKKYKFVFIKNAVDKGEKCFDILALHLNEDYTAIPPTLDWFKKEMENSGYKKPIWVNNMASGPLLKDFQETDNYITLQAKLMVKKVVAALASGAEKVFVTSEVDWTQYFSPEWRNMGLLQANGTPKPSFYNYKMLISKLSGYAKAEKVSDNIYKFSFNNKSPVLIAWSDSGGKIINLAGYFGKLQKIKTTSFLTKQGETDEDFISNKIFANSVSLSDIPVIIEDIR